MSSSVSKDDDSQTLTSRQITERLSLLLNRLSAAKADDDKKKTSKISSDGGKSKSDDTPGSLDKACNELDYLIRAFRKLESFEADLSKPLETLENNVNDIAADMDSNDAEEEQIKQNLDVLRSNIIKVKVLIPVQHQASSASLSGGRQFLQTTSASKEVGKLPSPYEADGIFLKGSFLKEFQARYEKLETRSKLCLLSFAIFPENAEVKKRLLRFWWQGEMLTKEVLEKCEVEETLKLFVEEGFIEAVSKGSGSETTSYTMHPIIRCLIIRLAQQANFFNYDPKGYPSIEFFKSKKLCLVKFKGLSFWSKNVPLPNSNEELDPGMDSKQDKQTNFMEDKSKSDEQKKNSEEDKSNQQVQTNSMEDKSKPDEQKKISGEDKPNQQVQTNSMEDKLKPNEQKKNSEEDKPNQQVQTNSMEDKSKPNEQKKNSEEDKPRQQVQTNSMEDKSKPNEQKKISEQVQTNSMADKLKQNKQKKISGVDKPKPNQQGSKTNSSNEYEKLTKELTKEYEQLLIQVKKKEIELKKDLEEKRNNLKEYEQATKEYNQRTKKLEQELEKKRTKLSQHLENKRTKYLENLQTLFNVSKQFPDLREELFSKMKNIGVLYLGRWEPTTERHLEVENTDFLKGLKNMNKLNFFSLQGISGITTLPKSLAKLSNLKILDLRACHNLVELPREIGSLKTLIHLDLSECYLLDNIPKQLAKLSDLKVLKGFVISKNSKCTLQHLIGLSKLEKLSINVNDDEFSIKQDGKSIIFSEFKSLKKLKISWGAGGKGENSPNENKEKSTQEDKDKNKGNGSDRTKSETPKSGGTKMPWHGAKGCFKSVPEARAAAATANAGEVVKPQGQDKDIKKQSSNETEKGTRAAAATANAGEVVKPQGHDKDITKQTSNETEKGESKHANNEGGGGQERVMKLIKLDLQCYPEKEPPPWLVPETLTSLERLYIRGGELGDLQQISMDKSDKQWEVKTLRLKYLSHIKINWKELQQQFPKLECLEKVNCPQVSFCPCDASGVWVMSSKKNAA